MYTSKTVKKIDFSSKKSVNLLSFPCYKYNKHEANKIKRYFSPSYIFLADPKFLPPPPPLLLAVLHV